MRNSRAAAKQDSRLRILEAGSRRLRREGLAGAAIAPVMADAGLTHGTFYSHFTGKEALATAAFRHALVDGRPRWMAKATGATWRERLASLAAYYLRPRHRDDPGDGCPFAALATEAARAPEDFRKAFEAELATSLAAIADGPGDAPPSRERDDQAIAFMALCVGGLALSRAVANRGLSDRILAAAQAAAARLADPPTATKQDQ